VDLSVDNPVGRVPNGAAPRTIQLRLDQQGWALGHTHRSWSTPLETLLSRLDTFHSIDVTGVPPAENAVTTAKFLTRAICRGTALTSAPQEVTSALPSELAPTVGTPFVGQPGQLLWDIAAVTQRRVALGPIIPKLPPVSLVLVSRRADLVAPMIEKLAETNYPNLEIVVGLHGIADSNAIGSLEIDVPLTVKSFPKDDIFGDVVNQTFNLASGELVTKIDDDDYYSQDHIWDLVAAHQYSGACLVGKSTTTIYVEELDATVRRNYGVREAYTHRVAGGTMLLSLDDLRELGGWPSVPRAVDTALISRILEHGGNIYQPHDIGYVYVRSADGGHTWTTNAATFLRNASEQWVGLYMHEELGTHK